MILYKYVPFDSGRKIIETNSIGFSQPRFFNDPFDLPEYPLGRDIKPVGEHALKADMKTRLRFLQLNSWWEEATGILSLTRTPTNPLMWAHYAQGHKGIVLGIDMVGAALADPDRNLVPAQFGSVVYVSRRSQDPFLSTPETTITIGSTYNFHIEHYERFQRLFLHKPLCWAYEEEVRVLKCIEGIAGDGGTTASGSFKVLRQDGRPLYAFSLPKGCIREVYFGIRADIVASEELYHQLRTSNPEVTMFECTLDGDQLSVGFMPYSAIR